MIPPLNVLQEIQEMLPPEIFDQSGFALYPIDAETTSKSSLEQYQEAQSDEEREEIDKLLLASTCFQGNFETCQAYLEKNSELTLKIANLHKKLQGTPEPLLEDELSTLEENLTALNKKTAETIWMTDSEMQVHRDGEERGFTLPPIWGQMVSQVRKEYCSMATALYGIITSARAFHHPHDEFRLDMLRYATCLLKYYGFTCSTEEPYKIQHPFYTKQIAEGVEVEGYKGGAWYLLMNPTWEHLEEEMRTDLKKIGMAEDQIPSCYPDTPSVDPSPLKTQEILSNTLLVNGLTKHLLKEEGEHKYKERPFF